MPDLLEGFKVDTSMQPKGTRRSERRKKPSSHFKEKAGFIVQRSDRTKKKALRWDAEEGTTSKPLLISDWTNTQLSSYCDACSISFTDFANECFNHIRKLEKSLSAPLQEQASSLEDRVA